MSNVLEHGIELNSRSAACQDVLLSPYLGQRYLIAKFEGLLTEMLM